MKTEIEVKARIDDVASLMEKLLALGCVFSDPVTQDDTVFAENIGSLDAYLSNRAFLRIRIQDDGAVLLTAKRRIKSAEGLVKLEHEVKIDAADEARGMLELMGYQEAVRVKKTRRVAHYRDYEICIDEIEGLGSFIELEQMADSDEAGAVLDGLLALLDSLGIAREAQVKKGYDILMIEKAQ